MNRFRVGLVWLALLDLGCPSDVAKPQAEPLPEYVEPPPGTPRGIPGPTDEVGVLAVLAPVPVAQFPESPNGSLELRYRVTGPGGLEGELVVIQKAGGWRSERWNLTSGETTVSGRTIATPTSIWTTTGDDPGETTDNHLGALATAWLALPAAGRDAALTNLRAWRAELDQSRREQPGEVETIEGVECVRMRIAAQSLCLWEQTGLLLRYEGGAFELVVSGLTVNPSIPTDEFVQPAQAKAARRIPSDPIDGPALVAALADGKVEPIAGLLAPGLRLPTLTKDDSSPAN